MIVSFSINVNAKPIATRVSPSYEISFSILHYDFEVFRRRRSRVGTNHRATDRNEGFRKREIIIWLNSLSSGALKFILNEMNAVNAF